jgi:hypothetical protein
MDMLFYDDYGADELFVTPTNGESEAPQLHA